MNALFFLPEMGDSALFLKLVVLGVCVSLVCWLLTILFLNILFRPSAQPRDLDVARSRFTGILWTLFLLQVYTLLVVHWNLDEAGRESMASPAFLMRFLPELLCTIALVVSLFLVRRSVLSSTKLDSSPSV